MIDNEIQAAIECWASRPTWFSSHPSDAQELKKAISNIKKLKALPSKEELSQAIYNRVKNLPMMLGSPDDTEKASKEFAAKISSKL